MAILGVGVRPDSVSLRKVVYMCAGCIHLDAMYT